MLRQKIINYYHRRVYGSPKLSVLNGASIVAVKKQVKSQKDKDFKCVVLEEKDFLDSIQSLQKTNLNAETGAVSRAQALVKVTSVHYTFVDIQNDRGKLSFFILEAATSLEAENLAEKIKKMHPDANVYFCMQRIQKDGENCFNFALSDAATFDKMPTWHARLNDLSSNGTLKQTPSGVYTIERKHLPIEAFKQTQRIRIGKDEIEKRSADEYNKPVNKYGDTLDQHLERYRTESKKVVNLLGEEVDLEIDSNYIPHKFDTNKALVKNYLEGKYKESSLYVLFKESLYASQSDTLSVYIGAKQDFQMPEEEIKYRWLKWAIELSGSMPIIEAIFEENPKILDEIGPNRPVLYEVMKSIAVVPYKAELVDTFIKAGASTEVLDPQTGLAPVHVIVREFLTLSDKTAAVLQLREHGADILIKSKDGKTIIDYLDLNNNEDLTLFQELVKIEPRILQLYPQLQEQAQRNLNEQPSMEREDVEAEHPILRFIGDDQPLKKDELLEIFKRQPILDQLKQLEEIYELIKENPDGRYQARGKIGFRLTYDELLSKRQLSDIKELKLAYVELIKQAVKNCDEATLAKIIEHVQPSGDPKHPSLIDFNRSTQKLFSTFTTSTRKTVNDIVFAVKAERQLNIK